MLFDKSYRESSKNLCKNDEYFRLALEQYLLDARLIDDDRIHALLEDFDIQKAEQQKDNNRHYPPCGVAMLGMLETALKLTLLIVLEDDRVLKRTGYIKKIVLSICSMADWVTQGKTERRFDADLCTGDTAAAIGAIYTVIRNECDKEERKAIENGLLHKGILPIYNEWLSPEYHWHTLDTMGHNWWLVIVAGAGIALLAVGDKLDGYKLYLEAVIEGIKQWFDYPGNLLLNKKANFGRDGDFIEFIGYLTYGLSNYVIFENMYVKKYGNMSLRNGTLLGKLVDYYISHYYDIDGTIYMANFGDTPSRQLKHQHVIYALATITGRGDLLFLHKKMSPGPLHFFDFLFYSKIYGLHENELVTTPLRTVYRHAGYAVIRAGYRRNDGFFAMKTGEGWNHNHLDSGSFILTYGGREIAVDSGICSYDRSEYRNYFTTPRAHNVVLFNGIGQDSDMILSGTKFQGNFPVLLSAGDNAWAYLLADCTGSYINVYARFYRHLFFLDGLIVFIDDIQTYSDGELSWLMHVNGDINSENDCIRISSNNSPSAWLHPLFPQNQSLSMPEAFRSQHVYDDGSVVIPEGRCLSLSSAITNRRGKLIQAIRLPGSDIGSLRMKTDGKVIEIIIDRKSTTERILCNTLADGSVMHKNANITYGSVSTDAFLVYFNESKNYVLKEASVINGSILSIAGEVFCSSMLKIQSHFNIPCKKYTVHAPTAMTLHIHSQEGFNRVSLLEGDNTGTW